MMGERGLTVDHVTSFRWIQRYAPEINKRMRPHLKMRGAPYHLDETYVKVGTEWKYLYRAVDSIGRAIEFMLSAKWDVSAAKRFFEKLMRADHRRSPFTIGTDKNASYPEAFAASVREKVLPADCKLRRVKYLNNIIDQDHRAIRRRRRAMQCFRFFNTAERAVQLALAGEAAEADDLVDALGAAAVNLHDLRGAGRGRFEREVLDEFVELAVRQPAVPD